MRFDHLRPGNQWFPFSVPNQADFGRLDAGMVASIDGDGGGTYTLKPGPSGLDGSVGIGGAGMSLTSSGTLFQGGVTTKASGRLVLGASDWPQVSPTRGRTMTFPFLRQSVGGFVSPATSGPFGLVSNAIGATAIIAVPGRRLHDAVNLASITFRFRVGRPHAGVPATMPIFALYAAALTDSTFAPIFFGSPAPPATGDLWYAAGAPKSYTLTVGATVDTKAHAYAVGFVDENSTNALPGNGYTGCTFTFNSINDLHFA